MNQQFVISDHLFAIPIMRGINIFAGLGTILIFVGIYCFKALLKKNSSRFKENMHGGNIAASNYTKVILIATGSAAVIAGFLLILYALKLI